MFLYSHLSLLDSQATKNISTSIFKRTKQLTLSKDKFTGFMDSSLLQTKDNQSSFYKLPKIMNRLSLSNFHKKKNSESNQIRNLNINYIGSHTPQNEYKL